jgi:hypothetical protein
MRTPGAKVQSVLAALPTAQAAIQNEDAPVVTRSGFGRQE